MKKLLLPALIIIPVLLIALFYLYFREGTVFYQALGIENKQLHFFHNELVNSLPSFVHVYAFSLITWWINGNKNALFSVMLWVMINCVFELGQLLTPDQLSHLPTLLANFFANGHYSGYDMIAIVVGALVAYFTTTQLNKAQSS